MIHKGHPWDEYRADGRLNASLLAHSFKSWRQVKWVIDRGFQPKTSTRVGTAAHHIVEMLPEDRFDAEYVVMPNYAISPKNVTDKGKPSKSPNTKWVKDEEDYFRYSEERIVLTWKEYSRLGRIVKAIADCEEAMDLIMGADDKELTIFDRIGDVDCKCRIDGITAGCQWNVKTTRNIERFKFQVGDLHYLWKDAYHYLLAEANAIPVHTFKYIVVEDAIPLQDGSYNCAPECCVKKVPLIALDNWVSDIHNRVQTYAECLESGRWPGMVSGDLEILDMPEITLRD